MASEEDEENDESEAVKGIVRLSKTNISPASEDEDEDLVLTVDNNNNNNDHNNNNDNNNKNNNDDDNDDNVEEGLFSCLHDSLALGNVETSFFKGKVRSSAGCSEQQQERLEVERLPLLLRILSKSRPLASVSSFPEFSKHNKHNVTTKKKSPPNHKKNFNQDEGDTTESEEEDDDAKEDETDDILEEAVRRLEDRAALYSVSEGVEVVACHLAPHVARKISKLPPCQKRPDGQWETAELVEVARNPAVGGRRGQTLHHHSKKRRRLSSSSKLGSDAASADHSSDNNNGADSDDFGDDMGDDEDLPNMPKRKRIASSDSMGLPEGGAGPNASEDSQEAFVTKALTELAWLVARYLQHENKAQPMESSNNQHDHTHETQHANEDALPTTTTLMTSMEESILAQARVVSETGAMIGTDLGATVASLFHHATVLRHSHTAAALCHAGQPQSSHLIQRLAANCPAAIPGLLRGCIHCILTAARRDGSSAADTAKRLALARSSILALSRLSNRERQRIRTTLRYVVRGDDAVVGMASSSATTLLEVQLEIALDHGDPVDLACFLIQHLSSTASSSFMGRTMEKETTMAKTTTSGTTTEAETPAAASTRETTNDDEDDEEDPRSKPLLAQLISGRNADTRIPQICDCLIQGMRSSAQGGVAQIGRLSGRLCLLLRAFLWLVLTLQLEDMKKALGNLLNLLDAANELTVIFGIHNWTDDLYCLSLSSMLCCALGLAGDGVSHDDQKTFKLEQKHAKLINDIFCGALTIQTKVYAGCLACSMLTSTEKPVLRLWILKYLGLKSEDIPACTSMFLGTEVHIRKWCQDSIPDLSFTLNSALQNETIIIVDPSALILALDLSSTTLSKERVEQALKAVLLCEKQQRDESIHLLPRKETLDFINKAAAYLDTVEGVKLPIVLPLHLEMQARRFMKHPDATESATFLLQFVYCFVFRYRYPDSPFSFNPRLLPLKEVWLSCDSSSDEIISPVTKLFLMQHIEKCAPDVVDLARYQKRIRSSHHFLLANRESLGKEDIKRSLRACISCKETDPSGEIAEQLFLRALLTFTEEELVTNTVSAFISRPKSPPVCFSLPKLYGDPLVLLKCPIENYWARPGVRRVALFVLSLLLNANTSLVTETCNHETTTQELIAARDLLVVRCLILSAIKTESSVVHSFATVALVRWIICSRVGLAAALLKQGLPPEELDWLTDFVPEIMSNPVDLATLFSDRVSLTPPERLAVADGVVRAIVLYGQRDDLQSETLVIHAMSQLLSAFFLMVGVNGVSVSSLISENNNSSADATQLSRKGALRIVKHASAIRGYRKRLRSECVMALQKLFRMCKGEEMVGGLPAVAIIGPRQKGTLKEIQDAVAKALSAMGAGL